MPFRIALFLIIIAVTTSCSPSASDRFIDDYKDKEKSISMTIPGWLIHTGAKFADDFSDDSDEKVFRTIADHIDGLRFMVVDKCRSISPTLVKELLVDMVEKDGYEKYVVARNGSSRINVMIREKESIIKNLTLVIQDKGSFALAKLDTKLPLDVLKEAKFSFNNPSNQVLD